MPAPTRFSELLYRYLDRAESLMLVLIIAGVVCHFLHLNFADQVLVIAFSGLAIVFFLNAYRPPTPPVNQAAGNPPARKGFIDLLTHTIVPKVLWLSCAIGAAALSMIHQHAEGFKEMFAIQGAAAIGGLVVVGLAAAMGKNIHPFVPILYRVIPITLVGAHYLGYY